MAFIGSVSAVLMALTDAFEDITTPLESLSRGFNDFLSIFFSFSETLNKISTGTLHATFKVVTRNIKHLGSASQALCLIFIGFFIKKIKFP
jgi:hypothetical protein